jgi:uncharacterized membrane protein YqgA involved in biofilm formation
MINAAGIVLGGLWALSAKRPLSHRAQSALKIFLGASAVWFGLKLAWMSLGGNARQVGKEIGIALLALALGKMVGKLMRLQKLSNSVGRSATAAFADAQQRKNLAQGFFVATTLFCVGPLALLASVQEGLEGFSPIFIVKAGTDGLATWAFVSMFGWRVILSALPVLALESTLIRGARCLEPFLRAHSAPLVDSINLVDGLLIFCVAMILLELKKMEVADYVPSLVLAPLLTMWLW